MDSRISLDTIVRSKSLRSVKTVKKPVKKEAIDRKRLNNTRQPEKMLPKPQSSDKKSQTKTKSKTIETKSETDDNIDSKVKEQAKPAEQSKGYESHTRFYSQFMSDMYKTEQVKTYSLAYEAPAQQIFSIQPEVGYTRRIQSVLKIAANKLMGGPHNHVDPSDVEDYKFWKLLSKFNRTLARMYAQGAGLPCYG